MLKKALVTTTVGYFIIALGSWMHGLPLAGWVPFPEAGAGTGVFPLSIVLLVIAVLSYLNDEILDSLVFFGFATLAWSHATASAVMPGEAAYGWNLLFWTLYFFGLWWGGRAVGGLRVLFLLALWVGLAADVLKHWTGARAFALIEGYLGLIAGLLALLAALRAATAGREPAT